MFAPRKASIGLLREIALFQRDQGTAAPVHKHTHAACTQS